MRLMGMQVQFQRTEGGHGADSHAWRQMWLTCVSERFYKMKTRSKSAFVIPVTPLLSQSARYSTVARSAPGLDAQPCVRSPELSPEPLPSVYPLPYTPTREKYIVNNTIIGERLRPPRPVPAAARPPGPCCESQRRRAPAPRVPPPTPKPVCHTFRAVRPHR